MHWLDTLSYSFDFLFLNKYEPEETLYCQSWELLRDWVDINALLSLANKPNLRVFSEGQQPVKMFKTN